MAKTRPPVLPAVRHPRAAPDCTHCAGAGWVCARRDSASVYPEFAGRYAVEACAACTDFGPRSPATVTDESVAELLRLHGVRVRTVYPCVVLDPPLVPPEPADPTETYVLTPAQHAQLNRAARKRRAWAAAAAPDGRVLMYGVLIPD